MALGGRRDQAGAWRLGKKPKRRRQRAAAEPEGFAAIPLWVSLYPSSEPFWALHNWAKHFFEVSFQNLKKNDTQDFFKVFDITVVIR